MKPIVLGDLRQFAGEAASYHVSDEAGDRQINLWINQALGALRAAHDWQHFEQFTPIDLDISVAGTGLTATQGSRDFSLTGGETILTDYLTEGWELVADGGSFTVDEKLSPTTGRFSSVWTDASDTGLDYYWVRQSYSLPSDLQTIRRLEVLQLNSLVQAATPRDVDRQRALDTTRDYPRIYAVRRGRLHVWPPCGTTYYTLGMSYSRAVALHDVADADEAEVDWPPESVDLLQAAVVERASFLQGKNAIVPWPLALAAYERLLSSRKTDDARVVDLVGDMGRPQGSERETFREQLRYYSGTIADEG